MTADLGARKIREELDALMVLGVDPIKSLVVPRFLSLMLLTPLFTIYALLFGTLGGVLVTVSNGAQVGPFFSTFFAQATTVEFQAMLVKSIDLRRDDRDRLLLQGADRLGRRRGGRPRGQPGGRDRVPRASARSTTRSRRRCWPPTRRSTRRDERPVDRLAADLVRRRASLSAGGSCCKVFNRPRVQVHRRDGPPGRDPDHRLGGDRARAGVHPRPAVRDRGRLRAPSRSARPPPPARSPRCATCAR